MKTIIIDGVEYNLTPKVAFREGDLVVIDGEVLHVKEVTEDGYLTDEGGLIPFRNEKEAHIWTIQDAKAGDVLVTGNKNIFIFKSISGYTIYDYCGLYFEKFTNSSGTVNGKVAKQLPTDYVPATKEQRDLLFSKMKEAGYEWDAEHKQLKKIEQLPIDVRTTGYWHVENAEQNSSWSEEDEKSVNIILDICSDFKKVYSYSKTVLKDANKIESFLKSLKERVQPQSKQEWNEDAQQWIDSIIKDYEERYDADKDHRATIQVKINILKSLRPQSTWKPSDEQMHYLSWIANIKLGDSVVEQEVSKRLNELLEDLKKLKG